MIHWCIGLALLVPLLAPESSADALDVSPPPLTPIVSSKAELFSVAPLMGHTNRHYRYFVRLFSQKTFLYTEMIPSSQILRAYQRARTVLKSNQQQEQGEAPQLGTAPDDITVQEIRNMAVLFEENPDLEEFLDDGKEDELGRFTLANLLLGTSHYKVDNKNDQTTPPDGSTVLQLGGRDPETLGLAAAIGCIIGKYQHINLNCGCPSNAVSGGRSSGAALMREPDLVAACVNRMYEWSLMVAEKSNGRVTAARTTADHDGDNRDSQSSPPFQLSVKHRLGVRDAATFDVNQDQEAYQETKAFVSAISVKKDVVTKCQVHGRLALLGEFAPTNERVLHATSCEESVSAKIEATNKSTNDLSIKVNHKRLQIAAKKRARQATIDNRNVPPLRPNIVQRLANDFPAIQFIANGGIDNLDVVKSIVGAGLYGTQENRVVGAMVGRAFLNHPCSFAAADDLWGSPSGINVRKRPTRREVLQQYVAYCCREEERLTSVGGSKLRIDELTRKLVAVPFHLFMGEEGNDLYQRQIKKLMQKTVRIKASSILTAAAACVPATTLEKCVDDFVDWKDIKKYDGSRRSSAMQRVVY